VKPRGHGEPKPLEGAPSRLIATHSALD
jgi:hypothetical protein